MRRTATHSRARSADATAGAAAARYTRDRVSAAPRFKTCGGRSGRVRYVEGRQADVGDFLLTEKIRLASSRNGKFVGAVANAPPVMVKDTPAAPNAKAALLVVRFVARFALAIVELRVQIARNLSRPCSYELVRENLGCWVETPR